MPAHCLHAQYIQILYVLQYYVHGKYIYTVYARGMYNMYDNVP